MKSSQKSKVRIYVKRGKLQGYSINDTIKSRRSILKKLLKKTPYGDIIKRLNVLAIYNKNIHPKTSEKVKSDISYIIDNLSKTSIRKPKRSTMKKASMKKPSMKKPSMKKRSMKKPSMKKRSMKKPSMKKRSMKKRRSSMKKRSMKKPSMKKRSMKKRRSSMKKSSMKKSSMKKRSMKKRKSSMKKRSMKKRRSSMKKRSLMKGGKYMSKMQTCPRYPGCPMCMRGMKCRGARCGMY